jgi:serine/threonine protein kinase
VKSERWEQISRIFGAAVALDEEAREVYLREQCGTDESLRHDVEKLISSHQDASDEGFIDSPAVEKVAALIAADQQEASSARLRKGQTLGSYLILNPLGAGGMGEVYLAKDTRLDRNVALKILPEEVAADKSRMQRFAQEAKVASALNQPNILTVFEFGEADSLHFLVTEYIDGETLRLSLRTRQLKLPEILDISIQIVAALEAAHEARIVHRDIKPENVMIRRRDHIVKVLDFGLAKLTQRESSIMTGPQTDTEAPTAFKTAPGRVVGTVAYMSPEQTQGLPVDERSDLWSTGIVIYEMAAGRAPFGGTTSSHTVVEILEKEAPPLSRTARVKVPDELDRIVRKTLAKNREERYQTASDLLIDLRNLRKRLDFESEMERSVSPGLNNSQTAEPGGSETQSLKQTSSDRSGKRIAIVSAAAALTLVALLGLWKWLPASKVVAPTPPAATANLPERQLSYWITVQKFRGGKPFENPFRLAGEINFERDYQVRLNLRSGQSGYLYVLNESPVGDAPLQILFPSTTANRGSALIAKDQEVRIPEQSWFQFDAEQGTETLWLVWSGNPLPEFEASKKFANSTDQGVINESALSISLKQFLRENRARDLKIERQDDPQETLLRSKEKLIVHAIKLAHN